MDLDNMFLMMEGKDTPQGFEVLKELEKISDSSNMVYPYLDKLIEMTGSKSYVIRVRGFRLFCRQAKWDIEKKIDTNISKALEILNDEKPTAVRQALTALTCLVPYKNDLDGLIKERVMAIDYLKYNETMHSLIAKDIKHLLAVMEKK